VDSELLQGFYLGDFLVEPVKGQVTGGLTSTHLPPKAMEVLLCLASSPGDLVTREELLESVWGLGHGSQETLSHAIGEIRHAFDDHPDNPKIVQTLPKRGYRFLVTPQRVAENTSSVVLGTKDGVAITNIGLLKNLQRRGVFETALAYLIVGWLLIQIADVVFSQLHLPSWIGTFVTMLVIAGFPIALVLSWFLEFRDGRAVMDDLSPAAALKRRFSRTYLSVVGALGIAAVGVFTYDQLIGLPTAEPTAIEVFEARIQPPPIVDNSLAVLPFLNLDGSEETQVFANGLVDDVITRLARIPGLHVASRGDSFTLAPNSASQDVRDRLRVEMYIEGSVEMSGEFMRVTVQLINSETGFHILARTFDKTRDAFFEVRDEITSLTVANVRVALPPNVRTSALQGADDPSLDVYVLYRRGIEASRQPRTMATIESALGWFDAALSVDPGYAAAHAGKCDVYVLGYRETSDLDFVEKAEAACARALELNPNLVIVHTSLGVLYRLTGENAAAEAEYKAALRIDPSNVESLTGLGEIYARQKRFDEAEGSLRSAVDIHPGNSATYNMLGVFLFQTGRFAEAVEQYQYVVALRPGDMIGYSNLGAALMQTGDFASAAPAYQKAIEIEPKQNTYSNLGLMHYYMGNLDAAIESHRSAVELQPNDHLGHSNLGDVLWAANRRDEAAREFELAETLATTLLTVNTNSPFTIMDLAWIKAMLNKHEEARQLIDKALNLAPEDPYSHYYNGMVSLRAGDRDAALKALQLAADMGYSRQMLTAEPYLEPLRSDPRFLAIVKTD
jgi:tetratricopeptide (TPR) repeat protein/TolB-like protein/DNA-binding winged helix-turn-helix (wHTH) protein